MYLERNNNQPQSVLRFFRQIRQRLLTENRFSKYLLYAVGEVLLVVIGILIALQIDNLNEERKAGNQESKLLLELVNNLESNLQVLEESDAMGRIMIRNADTVLEHLENGTTGDSLREYFLSNVYNRRFNLSYATFETFKNIGFDLIKNDELRLEIIDLFEISYAHRITSRNEVVPIFFQEYMSWAVRNRQNFDEIFYSTPGENDENQIFIRNYLQMKKSWELSGVEWNKRLIRETSDLKNHIESYLNTKR